MNFFMEIAMLRAARYLWHDMLKPFNPKNPKSSMLRTHVQPAPAVRGVGHVDDVSDQRLRARLIADEPGLVHFRLRRAQ